MPSESPLPDDTTAVRVITVTVITVNTAITDAAVMADYAAISDIAVIPDITIRYVIQPVITAAIRRTVTPTPGSESESDIP